MIVEFGAAPGSGVQSFAFPAEWTGTTTPVHVSGAPGRVTVLLGIESWWGGRTARGIFEQPTSELALVVEDGCGFLIKGSNDGLAIARVDLRPIVHVVQRGAFVAMASDQAIWLQSGDAVFDVPVSVTDGFDQLCIKDDGHLSGRAWFQDDWCPFSVSVDSIVSGISKRVDLDWHRVSLTQR